ncbi:MAG: hypothetical protein U0359_02715 [Byssovorax sp.]
MPRAPLVQLLLSASLAAGVAACSAAPLPPAPPPPAPPPPPVRAPSFVATEPPEPSRIFDVHLVPERDPAGEVSVIEVEIRLSEPPGEFGDASPLVLSIPDEVDGEPGSAEAIDEVYARDAEGALGLKQAAVPARGDVPAHAEWRSDRHPDGAISVTYKVRVGKGEGGKSRGLRAQAGGVQGTGESLLLLPEAPDPYTIHLSWDVGGLGEGAVGLSSFGEEDVEIPGPIPLDRLARVVFMAGQLGRLSIDDGRQRFHAAWLGKPGFDPVEALSWAARARAVERRLFHDKDAEPFTIFLSAVPRLGPSLWASPRPGGLLLLAGDQLGFSRSARFSLGQALARRWTGDESLRFFGPEPVLAWLREGVSAYVARAALLRAGLVTPAEALDDLNEHVTRWTLSPLAGLPNSEIAARFASGEAARAMAEDRGFLYAAEVDAAIQAKTGGKRDIFDMLFTMILRAGPMTEEEKGQPPRQLSPGTFVDTADQEATIEIRHRYDALVDRGEKTPPASGTFGPCFKSVKKGIARFDLGFDEASLADKKVHGLRAGSAAARAGLREGDGILRASVIRSGDLAVDLTVTREGGDKVIHYVPAGDTVNGVLWTRVAGVPDSACARPLPPSP